MKYCRSKQLSEIRCQVTMEHIAMRTDHSILGLQKPNLTEQASASMASKALGYSLHDVAYGAVSLNWTDVVT